MICKLGECSSLMRGSLTFSRCVDFSCLVGKQVPPSTVLAYVHIVLGARAADNPALTAVALRVFLFWCVQGILLILVSRLISDTVHCYIPSGAP